MEFLPFRDQGEEVGGQHEIFSFSSSSSSSLVLYQTMKKKEKKKIFLGRTARALDFLFHPSLHCTTLEVLLLLRSVVLLLRNEREKRKFVKKRM